MCSLPPRRGPSQYRRGALGMDKLFETALSAVISQAGLVAALLLLGCVYFARQWAVERKEHKATTDKVFEMASEFSKASGATTEALTGLKGAIEREQLIRLAQGSK